MIIPGHSLITRKIIHNVLNPAIQTQPCGIDLTLKKILTWTSSSSSSRPGTIDFDNSQRQTASTTELPFVSPLASEKPRTSPLSLHLQPGSYLVEFNETVSVPLDLMGQIFVRSSLWRSGALVNAGVLDAGYQGAVGGLLQVLNPGGLKVFRDARMAQVVFSRLEGGKLDEGEGYCGTYQGSGGL